jgi:hypothetical protein
MGPSWWSIKITSKITSNLLNEIVFLLERRDGHHQKNNFPFPQTKMNEFFKGIIHTMYIVYTHSR